MSDAVDRSVAQIDFRPLAGKKVYLDATYLSRIKTLDLVNADYIASSLRQQLFACGCLVHDTSEEADYIVEVRLGALATDGHDVVIGIPANNAVAAAAVALPNAPPVPTIPEIALARRNAQSGAAKIAAFAFHRETKRVVWQSGISRATGDARDTWVFGAGPFQRGTVYDGTQFAGEHFDLNPFGGGGDDEQTLIEPVVPYDQEVVFENKLKKISEDKVNLATFDEEVVDAPAPDSGKASKADASSDDNADKAPADD